MLCFPRCKDTTKKIEIQRKGFIFAFYHPKIGHKTYFSILFPSSFLFYFFSYPVWEQL